MAEAKYILMDGEPVLFADAKVHVLSPAITYAAMVFEGIRAYWNAERRDLYLFRLDDHLRRLQESMKVMRFECDLTMDALREQAIRAVQVNEFRETIHMRMMAIVTGLPPGITTTAPVSLVVATGRFPMKDWQKTGMAVGVSSWQRVHESSTPPRVKTSANYTNGRLGMVQAQRDGYDATLMLTREGRVAEAPTATLFMLRKGRLVTPGVTESILESVTRDTIIGLARTELGLEVEERPVDRTELYSAEEVFLCGSGWEVVPVSSIDRIPVGTGAPGPVTASVRSTYLEVVEGRRKGYDHWLTPVWSR